MFGLQYLHLTLNQIIAIMIFLFVKKTATNFTNTH